ncbi:MAG: hypothetical protein KDC69_03900 [Flavobacteriaceae bacterium]|nr:hypothetical protein [Flavobacteriaceae bacterium]
MPFTEFITNGDLKFILVFIIFSAVNLCHFFKKLRAVKREDRAVLAAYHNSKIDIASFWILISSVLSLLLGLLHSFYFIGKAGGIAPPLIYRGISYTLITPVLGISLFILCKILKGIFNPKTIKA